MTENPAIYSREYFQRLHDVEERHWWSQGMRDVAEALIEAHFGRRDDLDILDAGCGTGITLGWLRRYSRHRPVEGIDVAPEALRRFTREGAQEDAGQGAGEGADSGTAPSVERDEAVRLVEQAEIRAMR